MKICVIGTGYVGLVTAACLANLGNAVTCVDNDREKISALQKGMVPFYEPGLEDLVKRNSDGGRILFSTDPVRSIRLSEVVFIAVGTPSKGTGEADISAVIEVAKQIAKALKINAGVFPKIIVNKSTVPVGMGDIVTKILVESGASEKHFAVVSNPEFLREGSAISDFMHPERIVIGASNNRAFNVITELYRPLNAHIIFTSIKSAELIKYASNAFLATKISFINEIADICERVGADISEVADAMGLDGRIGRDFLNAGIGYGGSCLPKDISALMHLARENGYEPKILTSVAEVNEFQVESFVGKIIKILRGLEGRQIAVLGLSFKPQTDDLREAPSLKIIKRLQDGGARVSAYDPSLRKRSVAGVKVSNDAYSALKGADAMVLATEWAEFHELDFERVKKLLKKPIIFDGRNVYEPKKMRELGFAYHGVGK